jgi:hypothetical protein
MPSKNKYGIFSNCLRGDVSAAIRIASQNVSKLSLKERTQLKRLKARFEGDNPRERIAVQDPFIKDLIFGYRAYYRQVLSKRSSSKQGENWLRKRLCSVLRSHGIKISTSMVFDQIEKRIKLILSDKGYFSLIGTIHPFRSLSIWKRQRSKRHRVELPEISGTVIVNYIDQVIEHGWMSYATFGRFYPGGWVPDDAKDQIYCVAKAYRNRPEALRVNLIAHEAQHVVDLRKYPKLSPVDLEYRAKLTELNLSSRPVPLLDKFRSQATSDQMQPHGYAAWQICQSIQRNSGTEIREAAKTLLAEHSVLIARGRFLGKRNARSKAKDKQQS